MVPYIVFLNMNRQYLKIRRLCLIIRLSDFFKKRDDLATEVQGCHMTTISWSWVAPATFRQVIPCCGFLRPTTFVVLHLVHSIDLHGQLATWVGGSLLPATGRANQYNPYLWPQFKGEHESFVTRKLNSRTFDWAIRKAQFAISCFSGTGYIQIQEMWQHLGTTVGKLPDKGAKEESPRQARYKGASTLDHWVVWPNNSLLGFKELGLVFGHLQQEGA